MDIVAKTFYDTFSWQWLLLALPIALIVSLLVNRVIAAGIIALVAVAAQHLWPVVWPLLQQSAKSDAMMTAATETLQKINPLAAGMEWIAFTFFIAVFSLTRQDMFRIKPDH